MRPPAGASGEHRLEAAPDGFRWRKPGGEHNVVRNGASIQGKHCFADVRSAGRHNRRCARLVRSHSLDAALLAEAGRSRECAGQWCWKNSAGLSLAGLAALDVSDVYERCRVEMWAMWAETL